MLVEKIREEWKPAENPGLQVGEVIDITTPDTLIQQGMVKPFVKKEEPKKEEIKEVKETKKK